MKVIIAGSRDMLPDWEHIETLIALDRKYLFAEIVCGKAKGADTFGENYANLLDIPVIPFPADWDTYGKSAGPRRNKQMAEYADAVILFKGGSGTANMRKLAKEHNLQILYDEEKT